MPLGFILLCIEIRNFFILVQVTATLMEEVPMVTHMATPMTTPTHMEPITIYMLSPIPILMAVRVDHSSCMVSGSSMIFLWHNGSD